MALKDWTKMDQTSDRILWHSNDGNGVEIFKGVDRGRKVWYAFGNSSKLSGKFKTKSQALKYVKSFMRKN